MTMRDKAKDERDKFSVEGDKLLFDGIELTKSYDEILLEDFTPHLDNNPNQISNIEPSTVESSKIEPRAIEIKVVEDNTTKLNTVKPKGLMQLS